MAKTAKTANTDASAEKPVFEPAHMTIVAGAAGGVGGFRDWHYVAKGTNEDFASILEPGYFSRMGQIAHQDRCYVVAKDYVAQVVFVRVEGSDEVTALEAWSLDMPEDVVDPKVQTLPSGADAPAGSSGSGAAAS
jgi:hypothetical protein